MKARIPSVGESKACGQEKLYLIALRLLRGGYGLIPLDRTWAGWPQGFHHARLTQPEPGDRRSRGAFDPGFPGYSIVTKSAFLVSGTGKQNNYDRDRKGGAVTMVRFR